MPRALTTIMLCDTWLHNDTFYASSFARTKVASYSDFSCWNLRKLTNNFECKGKRRITICWYPSRFVKATPERHARMRKKRNRCVQSTVVERDGSKIGSVRMCRWRTDAIPRSSGERQERVRVALLWSFGQETVRVEGQGIGPDIRVPVKPHCTHGDCRALWYHVTIWKAGAETLFAFDWCKWRERGRK